MIEEHALVLSLEQDMAVLEIFRKTPCSLCGQTRGCGVSIWAKLFRHNSHLFKARNPIQAKVGDTVVVGVEENALLASSSLIYGLPLLSLLLGAVLATWLFPSALHADRNAMLGAALGLLASIVWLKAHLAAGHINPAYQAVILRADTEQIIQFKCE